MIVDSFEVEKLKKLIDNKVQYQAKQTNKVAAQYQQEEIMFLKRDILPLVEAGSQILTYELSKHYARALSAAIKLDCNGLVHYTGLNDDYKDRPRIAIVNPKDLAIGTPGAVLISIINMDCDGTPAEPVNLPLTALI